MSFLKTPAGSCHEIGKGLWLSTKDPTLALAVGTVCAEALYVAKVQKYMRCL